MSLAGTAIEVRTDDETLVAAVRRGDDRAFEALYGRYQRRIAAYAYGMVGDYGRAEDLTQEIFVSALRRIRATERPIAFKPWIYEIARNACIDQFRRSRRTEEVSFDAEEASGALEVARISGGTPADDAADAKQQLDDLRGAFGGLSDAHHEILVMRELEGRSYREIGERLGLSRPSVESTLFRARRRLTEEYEELVSGERCRRVSELLASGADSLGAREEKRLARHVAHCQPCRREAYAAGVDTATLTSARPRRRFARVAALLPIPAFLRLRGSANTAQWSNTVATMAEPAAGWTKAVAAAGVLLAGGAGVAAHDDITGAPLKRATPIVAPAPERTSDARSKRPSVDRPAPARTAPAPAAGSRDRGEQRASNTTKPPASTAGGRPASAPVAPADVPGAKAPSAGELTESPTTPQLPPVRGNEGPSAAAPEDGPTDPEVNVPAPDDAAGELTGAVTKIDGNAGQTLTDVMGGLGG